MPHTRLVGGLISLAALLTVLLVPTAIFAQPYAMTRPTPAERLATAPSVALPATSMTVPAPAFSVLPVLRAPRLTKAHRRARLWQRLRERLLRVAREQLGVPYVYGGASRAGFDCSGFTMFVYGRMGVDLAHGATDQAGRGRPVSLRRLEPGDLVFYGGSGYYSHVAIYAGHGRVIDAPHTGAVVSYSRLSGATTARRLIGR